MLRSAGSGHPPPTAGVTDIIVGCRRQERPIRHQCVARGSLLERLAHKNARSQKMKHAIRKLTANEGRGENTDRPRDATLVVIVVVASQCSKPIHRCSASPLSTLHLHTFTLLMSNVPEQART